MRPSIYTLPPFFKYSPAISASRSHNTMLCHSVRSCHWPSLSLNRSLVASENFATGLPCGVYLISGSLPRFPTRMTLFTLFMTPCSSKTLTIAELTAPADVSHEHQICDEFEGRFSLARRKSDTASSKPPRPSLRRRAIEGTSSAQSLDAGQTSRAAPG